MRENKPDPLPNAPDLVASFASTKSRKLRAKGPGLFMRKTAFMLLAVLGFSFFLWAQLGFTGSQEVVLSRNALVGSQVLPAGTYKVTHEMEGAEHIMVFTQKRTEFRLKCRLEPLTEKARMTLYWYDTSVGGRPVLEWIEFRGDPVRHVFIR